MIDTLCTGSLPGRASATRAWPISWWATISRSFRFRMRLFFSSPATMRSTAAVKSVSPTASAPRRVAALTPGFTGADLANLVNEATLVDQIGEIGAGEAGGQRGDLRQIRVRRQ